jgi:CpeT/CpcT family (DUF1001)
MRAFAIMLAGLLMSAAAHTAEPKMTAAEIAKTVQLMSQWIGGNYSTQAQHDADLASDKPDTEKHRLMFQLFKRIEVNGFEGVVFFEQGSRDGSTDPDMIWRSALVQILPDETLGLVRYRELEFKDQKAWHNAHLTPAKFKALTPSQVTWNAACDFLVTPNKAGSEIAGPIEAMQCSRINDGTGERMYAEDKIVVKPGEFWFLGRYVNAKGEHIWGNESDELNKLVKFADVP